MKQSLRSAVILLFCLAVASSALCTGGQPEGKGRAEGKGKLDRPSFIPEHARIARVMAGRVYAVADDNRYPDKGNHLYFSDAEGRLVREVDLFRGGFRGRLTLSSSEKFVGAQVCCPKSDSPSGALRKELLVMDLAGEVLWQEHDAVPEVTVMHFDDQRERVVLVDLLAGRMAIHTVRGKVVRDGGFSKWVGERAGEAALFVGESVASTEHVAVSRSDVSSDGEWFTELTLLGLDGMLLFQRTFQRYFGRVQFVSSRQRTVLVLRGSPLPAAMVAYDFKGNPRWTSVDAAWELVGQPLEEGHYVVLQGDRGRIDLRNGRFLGAAGGS